MCCCNECLKLKRDNIGWSNDIKKAYEKGLDEGNKTLRDEFAMAALNHIYIYFKDDVLLKDRMEIVAKYAYKIADAMLEELNKERNDVRLQKRYNQSIDKSIETNVIRKTLSH